MSQTTTLGQRIQSYRKNAGLSQEALGEQLQVSRQAVSKWESDITVPELESLITMSRIFGVSVGTLLGVEEPIPQAQEPSSPELTEKELAAVEAIAARYAAELAQHQKPKWSRKQRRWAIVLACIAILLAGLFIHRQLKNIDRQFTRLQQEVDGIESNVAWQIGQMSGQLKNILTESTSILNNFTVTVTDFDPKAETITLHLSASPKEWTETTTAIFTVSTAEGEQCASPEAMLENGAFTAEGLVVPMSTELDVSVSLLDGSTARSEPAQTLYDCIPENFALSAMGHWGSSWSTASCVVSMKSMSITIDSRLPRYCDIDLRPAQVDLCLYRNQELEPEQVIPLPLAVSNYDIQGFPILLDSVGEEHHTTFELAADESMAEVLRIVDNYGQTTYFFLDGHLREGGGNVQGSDLSQHFPWRPGLEVYK